MLVRRRSTRPISAHRRRGRAFRGAREVTAPKPRPPREADRPRLGSSRRHRARASGRGWRGRARPAMINMQKARCRPSIRAVCRSAVLRAGFQIREPKPNTQTSPSVRRDSVAARDAARSASVVSRIPGASCSRILTMPVRLEQNATGTTVQAYFFMGSPAEGGALRTMTQTDYPARTAVSCVDSQVPSSARS
jgi:hypothetical protein